MDKIIVLINASTNMLYNVILNVPEDFALPEYGSALVHGKAVFLPIDDVSIYGVGDVHNSGVVAGYYEDVDSWLTLMEDLYPDVKVSVVDEVHKI